MSIRIICISKAGGYHENPYLAISKLGWHDEMYPFYKKFWTREEMYDFVSKGGLAYVYDKSGLLKSKLIAIISPRGTKYVKTEANSSLQDNLLSLNEC